MSQSDEELRLAGIEREVAWEMAAVTAARERYALDVMVKDAATLPPGRRLMRQAVPQVSGAAVLALRECQRWPTPFVYLAAIGPDVAAVSGCFTLISRTLGAPEVKLTELCRAIAHNARMELDYARWSGDAENRERLQFFARSVGHTLSYATWAKWRPKLHVGRLERWREADIMAYGGAIIRWCRDALPDVWETIFDPRFTKSPIGLRLSPGARANIEASHDRASVSAPLYAPMICPPNPWVRV